MFSLEWGTMIERPTVLILGAGASKPYGFPLGFELRDDVIRMHSRNAINFQLRQIGITPQQYDSFIGELLKSGYSSVDAFLEDRKQWLLVGKSCIAQSLLEYEASTAKKLFPPNQPKDHWYETLWAALKAESWQSFRKNNLTIVTFNYDRSIEFYLSRVIRDNYRVSEEVAASLLRSFIIHVHGNLGTYKGLGEDGFKYAKRPDNDDVVAARKSIKIVHESNSSTKEFRKANHLLRNASTVIFVGFGFHPQNMSKMKIFDRRNERIRSGMTSIRGTHKGINTRACDAICNKYGFHPLSFRGATGSISENLGEWL
jgi:hypothetical protein